MKKRKLMITFCFVIAVGFFAMSCSKDTETSTTSSGSVTITSLTDSNAANEGGSQTASSSSDLLTNNTFSSVIKIVFSGTTATVTGSVSGVTVSNTNGDVSINSTASNVEYQISGTTSEGSLTIASTNQFKLTLDGVSIANSDGAAINITSGKAFVVLNSGTTNSLTDGTSSTIKATLNSASDLVFSGTGTLNVAGKYTHGIKSAGYVRVIEGNITVSEAVKDAIHTNVYYGVEGSLNLTATSDAIEAEEGGITIDGGTYTIKSAGDGIAASYSTDNTYDAFVTINGGTFDITATAEGIESKSVLTINGGNYTINTADDGLNAASAIYINGGSMYINSTDNDAIDTNGSFVMTGGRVVALGGSSPETGLDIDAGQPFKITGGTLIAAGNIPPGDNGTPSSNSTQATLVLSGVRVSSGSILNIQTSDAVEVLTFKAPKAFDYLIFTSSKYSTGKTYNVYTGGSVTDGSETNGLYTGGKYSVGTKQKTFTASSVVTIVN